MIDTNKYEGHTEGPWLELEVDKVVAYQFDENDNAKMVCNVFRDGDGGSAYEGEWGDDEVEANQKLIADAPLLLEEVKRLRKWIYHHANNLDAGGVHRMGTPQPLSTFADEAREAIGLKRGESLDIKSSNGE